MDKTTLAYIAGALDSDGTIGIKRSTYAMRVRGDATQPVYSERVALRQVTPEIPALLRECFGGYLGITKPSARNGKPLHSWQATDKRAVECLAAVLPYLLVKRAQAENCLALRSIKDESRRRRVPLGRGHAGAVVRPAELGERMESCYLLAKELNRVGVH